MCFASYFVGTQRSFLVPSASLNTLTYGETGRKLDDFDL